MDVKLTGPSTIPYLNQGSIEDYSSLKFYSENGELVKMNPTILAALNSTLIYSLLDDYEDCCVLTEFSKSDLEEINHFSWTGECKNIKVFIALGIDLQAIFFGQNPTVQVSSSFKVEVKDEILDHHMQGIDNIDDINDYNEDIILADVKREKTKKEKVLKKNRNGSPLKELQEPRIKRKYTKRKKSEEDEDDDDWTKAKPTKKKKKEKDPFFVSGTVPLTPEQQKLFESYETPRPIETYKVPPFESKHWIQNVEPDFSKAYACHICSHRFTANQNLQAHLIKLHSEHYNCYFCKKAFALDQADQLKLHMFKHEFKILSTCAQTCIQCGKYFRQTYKFNEHMRRKGPSHDDRCTQCSEKFRTYEDHKAHVESKHFGKWIYKCGFCKKQFEEESELKSHSLTFHVQPVMKLDKPTVKRKKYVPVKKICEDCGAHVSNLKTHMIGVHGIAKYTCKQCPHVTFKTTDSLKRHVEWVHVKVPCSECGIMIGRRKMPRHMNSKHTSIYDRKFKCDICGKGFNDKAKLSDHNNVHTGEKPFKCKFCNACFASRGTHAMHQRSHLGHRRTK